METPSTPSPIQRHGSSDRFDDVPHRELTERIIGAAIAVHRALGPGFLEAAYEESLSVEFQERGVPFTRQVGVTVRYRGVTVDQHRIDLIVDGKVVVEIKAASPTASATSARSCPGTGGAVRASRPRSPTAFDLGMAGPADVVGEALKQ